MARPVRRRVWRVKSRQAGQGSRRSVCEGDAVQTTLLGLAIALIVALIAALVGPYFVDWNQFRPQFEAEATRIVGAPVRVGGKLDARLLPTPSLQLHSVVVGGANDLGKVRADKLDVEFSLGSLMRGEWRATELTINGVALDLGLDRQGRIDWPASSGSFSLGSLAIDRLNLTGRVALHDALSRGTLELNDIAFSGDVRALAGSIRGDGNFTLSGARYPFRVSSGDATDGSGTRVHLNIDPSLSNSARAFAADLEGVLSFQARAPRFEGAVTLSSPVNAKAPVATPWRIAAKVKADPSGAGLEQLEASYGAEERALKFVGLAEVSFGAQPLLHAVLSARQLDADKFVAAKNEKDDKNAEPVRLLPGLRALVAAFPQPPIPAKVEFSSEQIILGGRPLQNITAILHGDASSWSVDRLDFRAPGATQVALSGGNSQANVPDGLKAALDVDSSDPDALMGWLQGRSEIAVRSQKPLHLHGDVSIATDRFAIDAMKAEIDGGIVAGRIALATKTAGGGSLLDAELKADRLDLDAVTSLARALAGPQDEWPDALQLSLDFGHAVSAGQELGPLLAKLGYDPKMISIERLKVGEANNVTLEGSGSFDRAGSTGKLALGFDRGVAGPTDRICRAVCAVVRGAAQCHGQRTGGRAPKTGARSRQEGLERSHHRRARSRCAAAQGQCGHHRDTARQCRRQRRSRRARPQRYRRRGKVFGGAGPCAGGAARARPRGRGRRRPGAVRGLGERRLARAAAAEGEDHGQRDWMPRRMVRPNRGRRIPRPISI